MQRQLNDFSAEIVWLLNILIVVAFLMMPDKVGDGTHDIWQRSTASFGTSRAASSLSFSQPHLTPWWNAWKAKIQDPSGSVGEAFKILKILWLNSILKCTFKATVTPGRWPAFLNKQKTHDAHTGQTGKGILFLFFLPYPRACPPPTVKRGLVQNLAKLGPGLFQYIWRT